MSLLLDTHAFLWWIGGSPKLPKTARDAIADPAEIVFVSAASAWEIAIKRALGRIDLGDDEFAYGLRENGFVELPIAVAHGLAAGALPRHHRDPFDRMLVAQARGEGLRLVTGDRALADYDVERIWA